MTDPTPGDNSQTKRLTEIETELALAREELRIQADRISDFENSVALLRALTKQSINLQELLTYCGVTFLSILAIGLLSVRITTDWITFIPSETLNTLLAVPVVGTLATAVATVLIRKLEGRSEQ